jgi:hypothetical protein
MTVARSGRLARVGLIVALGLANVSACTRASAAGPLEPSLGHSQPVPIEAEDARGPEQPEAILPDPPTSPTTELEVELDDGSELTAEAATPSIPPPERVTDEDEALCEHITTVVLTESGNAAELDSEQIDELTASCSVALAQDRRRLEPLEFRRRADCVRAASSIAGFSACEPEPASKE